MHPDLPNFNAIHRRHLSSRPGKLAEDERKGEGGKSAALFYQYLIRVSRVSDMCMERVRESRYERHAPYIAGRHSAGKKKVWHGGATTKREGT